MKRLIVIMALVCANCFGAFGISNSAWGSKSGTVIKYDKVEHFICAGALYDSFKLFGADDTKAVTGSIAACIAWEVKDGFMSYNKYGWFGGGGFCYKDLLAGIAGVVASYSLNKLIRAL